MELSSPIGGWIYPLAFLVVLTIVVFVHELGHFLTARACKVKVDAFSIGFGKEVIGWNDKHGTRWKISLLPIGGYVKFAGDLGPASTPDREKLDEYEAEAKAEGRAPEGLLFFKPLWQRSAVAVAGPVANFILGILIFAGVFMYQGDRYIDPVIGAVEPGSVADEAGFIPGDRILTIEGRTIESFRELSMLISMSAETQIDIDVLREGETLTLTASPKRVQTKDSFGNKQKVGRLGVQARAAEEDIHHIRYGPVMALTKGVYETGFIIERTFVYLGRMVVGKEDASQLGGPIRIAKFSGQMAQVSVLAVIGMIAVLSISVGLINLFPIPLMDGGHLLYYAVEAVRGKPLSERAQEAGFRIGLLIVLSIMVYATWNDLIDIDAFGKISGIFS
jgi:regulator of sigma E protease